MCMQPCNYMNYGLKLKSIIIIFNIKLRRIIVLNVLFTITYCVLKLCVWKTLDYKNALHYLCLSTCYGGNAILFHAWNVVHIVYQLDNYTLPTLLASEHEDSFAILIVTTANCERQWTVYGLLESRERSPRRHKSSEIVPFIRSIIVSVRLGYLAS